MTPPAQWTAVWLCVALAMLAEPATAQIPSSVSPDAPSQIVLRDLDGPERRLAEHRGRVLVLNFWATWCIPCRQEMPLLNEVAKRYAERGVIVIGASADDESTRAQIKPFVDELGISFPIWAGATTEHMVALGLGTGLPVTAVLDHNGKLAFRLLGVLRKKELEQRLDYLLAGGPGRAPRDLVDRISGARHDEAEEHHTHGAVGMEGASSVPS